MRLHSQRVDADKCLDRRVRFDRASATTVRGTAVTGCEARMRADDGFSLTELMVVLLVVGILLLIAVASYVPATGRAAAAACTQNRALLERAFVSSISARELDAPSGSETLESLRPYVQNFDQSSVCPSDGTTYTLVPASGDVICPNHP